MFAALDGAGPSSQDGLLAGRLANYEQVHMPTASGLIRAGFQLVPSFRRPHYTVSLTSDSLGEVDRLLRALGQMQANPYNREVGRHREEKDR